jgi:hypothetical protein
MRPITTPHELNEARAQPRAFVFIHVNWAIQAIRSRRIAEQFVQGWQAERNHRPTAAFVVDLSEQIGRLWDGVRQWLAGEEKPVDPLTYGGYGALLWLRAGRVMEYVEYTEAVALVVLGAISRRVFEELS